MSSKRRRKAREWMHRHVEAARSTANTISREAYERGRRVERESMTYLVPTDDEGIAFPLGKPQYERYIVAGNYRPWHRGGLPLSGMREASYYVDRRKDHHFRVTQHCLRLPDGLTVMWFGLELCR